MKATKLRENIYWVGAIDRDIRIFHGYATPYGTTYNAYLILDEQVTLIDTVKAPFTQEMLERIRDVVPLEKIDNIISNHVEPDHSGGLPALAELCPNAKIFTSPSGDKGLRAYYHTLRERQLNIVKTGDTLCTGKYTFKFVLMPMVHWPDSMATFLQDENILFSNDAFGQHIATDERFDYEIGLERLLERAADYYGNIVLPFGMQVNKLLGEVSGLTFEMICPSHGVILRDNIADAVEKYAYWAGGQMKDDRAVVVYDTMWGATGRMAAKIASGLEADGIKTELICLGRQHYSTAMGPILEAKYVFVGSPTLNRSMMPTVAAFMCYMKGLNPKSRVGMAFGAYGWSGESTQQIEEIMKGMGWETKPQRKLLWWPED